MSYTRREFGKLALASVPAAALLGRETFAQARPNSVISGVTIGTITYSYRSMMDQSAQATLRYLVESGISQVELMGGPVESFAGAPQGQARGGGGGGRGRGAQLTPEQQAAQQAAQQEQAARMRAWRTSASMDKFKELRKMYNDAGVTIYAWKQLNANMSDDEMDYIFNVAAALGATHTTLELPTDEAHLRRIGQFAEKHKIYAAYHTHEQGSMTAFNRAFEISRGNMANVDLGHYVAGGGGDPVQFLETFNGRISSFHMKDRQTPANGRGNLEWGKGDTPIGRLLQSVRRNRYTMPATIELEYQVPEGSDAVKEVAKCLDFCKRALA